MICDIGAIMYMIPVGSGIITRIIAMVLRDHKES